MAKKTKEKQWKVSLLLPDALYWRWQEEIPRRRVNQKTAVIQAIELWMRARHESGSPTGLAEPEVEAETGVVGARKKVATGR